MEARWGTIGRLGGLGGPTVKESLQTMRRAVPLRRSRSFSELQTLRRNAAVHGLNIHPGLPRPDALRHGKENKPSVRPTLGLKRPAGVAPVTGSLSLAAKKARPDLAGVAAAKTPGINSKTPVATVKSAPAKKIPPYDYKARFNDLLEKHKPIKADYLELKRNHDELSEELLELRTEKENYDDTLKDLRDNVASSQAEIIRLNEEQKVLIEKYECALKERESFKNNWEECETKLATTERNFRETSDKLIRSEEINRRQEQIISQQAEDIEDLQESTEKLHWERRSLHNKLQDLKGNIRVVFRVRPALTVGRQVASLNFPDACTLELERLEPGASKRLNKHDFKFDRVFGPMSSQEDVWEEVSCLIQSALDGYNVCIFAYGQTGSGKTYTMEGTAQSPGVIPRCCTMIFDSIKQLSKSGWKYEVHASFLEIYNEQLYDLLEPGKDPRDLDIRMADAKGSDVYVTNLSEQEVKSATDLLKLATRAQLNRQTAATAGNERSSRSHSVARIRLKGIHSVRALTLTSRMCLVDLAGSESAKNTQRLKETKNINRSLSELGQVILALQQKQEHVPFRNSKLTRLLEPQLGGAAKALLVAAAAPYEDCSHESLSTLRFATQVGHCSTAAARRNLALAQPTTVQAAKEAQ